MDRYAEVIDNYIGKFNANTEPKIEMVDGLNDIKDSGESAEVMSLANSFNSLGYEYSEKIQQDQLPKFSGNFTDWKHYKRIIEDLLINNNLRESIALSLLINTLDKEPLVIAKNCSSRGSSLKEIWAQLVKKYDNGDTLIIELRDELKKMPIVKSYKDLSNLKLAREITANIAATIALSELPSLAFQPLVQLVAERMYDRAQWEILAKLNDFQKVASYVENLFFEAENYDRFRPLSKLQLHTNPHGNKKLVAAINNSTKCIFCNENHSSISCSKLNASEKANLIKENRICIRYLSKGHTARYCRNKSIKCSACDRSHLPELHEVAVKLFEASLVPVTETKPKNVAAISVLVPETIENNVMEPNRNVTEPKQCSLITNVSSNVFVVDKIQICGSRPFLCGTCNGKRCKALIDFGSELTLMHPNLVNRNAECEIGMWKAGSPLTSDGYIVINKRTNVTFKNNETSVTIS